MNDFLADTTLQSGPFEPAWESLRTYRVPDWYRDAKLGIWAHWGPQCVPMFGDWYGKHIYHEGHPQYLHHWRTYGHPSKHGYKDIVRRWKAEQFDPDALMDLYVSAGAKYFVAQAVHHDNFDNWNSTHHEWNATKVGPMKNIVGLFESAARKRGLKFGVSEHLGASHSWFATNKRSDTTGPYAGIPYDGSDPAYASLYYSGHGSAKPGPENDWRIEPWYSDDVEFQKLWFRRIKDLVDQHKPDLLYSDGGVPWDRVGLSIVAHLYNLSIDRHGENLAVYNQKDANPGVYSIGVLDIERGNANEPASYVWQNDTCVGGWFYDVRQVYKTAPQVLETLVDCVSKNGNLLLNIPQRPDGSFDDECLHILKAMAAWMSINGEGIHGTRPWDVAIEGPSRIVSGHFKEDRIPWTTADFRFTSKGKTVYAFQMRYPEHRQAFVRSLGVTTGRKVKSASILGCPGKIVWRQLEDGLLVEFPEKRVCEYLPCIRIELA